MGDGVIPALTALVEAFNPCDGLLTTRRQCHSNATEVAHEHIPGTPLQGVVPCAADDVVRP